MAAGREPTHLVVLAHGVGGLASDLAYLAKLLRAYPDVLVFAPRCNEPVLAPFEGVAVGGERIVSEVLAEISQRPALRKLSLVGHSLGGLYVRYAAGVLYGRCGCTLIPLNMVTLATPHLGVTRPRTRPPLRGGAFNRAFQVVSERMCAQLGVELNLSDTADGMVPLLVRLAHGDFLCALRSFRRRSLYANVYNDFLVPFCTAALQPYNPYRRGEASLLTSERYPHITLHSLYQAALGTDDAGVNGGSAVGEPAERMCGAGRGDGEPVHGAARHVSAAATPLEHRQPTSAGARRLACALDEATATVERINSAPASAPQAGRFEPLGAPPVRTLTRSRTAPSWSMGADGEHPGVQRHGTERFSLSGRSRPSQASLAIFAGADIGARGVAGPFSPTQLSVSQPRSMLQRAASFGGEHARSEYLQRVLLDLNSVHWHRFDCVFSTLAAHEQIINKNAWTAAIGVDTSDVCRHIVDHFVFNDDELGPRQSHPLSPSASASASGSAGLSPSG